jgi:sulfite reductase beta subunit-like hemoprotein
LEDLMAVGKAEKIEAIKRAKDGLDVLPDIQRYAALGDYAAIEPDDMERLKWYGVYRQKPNDGHFMLRIKMPGGALTAAKLREIGTIGTLYARGFGDITTRQDIQFHWLRIENIPDVFDRIYNKMGMYQEFSCGDAPRNVTACPLAGLMADEIVDVGHVAQSLSDMYRAGGKEFSNLPRKHKTSICGCRIQCSAPQINEIGLFGVERMRNGVRETGLGVCIGGGLRDTPFFAQSLRVFLRPDVELVKDVCRKIVHIYRDQDSLRQGRLRARLKFYVEQIGWQAFRTQLEQYLGYELEHDESIVGPVGAAHDDHIGPGVLKNGLMYLGVPVARGRLSADQMIRLADLADSYCADPQRQLNVTIKQNILFLNVPPAKVRDLSKELADIGLPVDAHPLRRQLISCTGTQFCNLAVVETKERAKRILDYLETRVPMEEPLFISVTGCPNSCAHYQIADIGLQGTLYTYKGEKGVEHYHVLMGGCMGAEPRFGRFICRDGDKKVKVPAEQIHLAIEQTIRAFQAERQNGEKFADWSWRQSMERLADLITLPD